MGNTQMRLFGRTKTVENQFDQFLDTVSQGAILYRAGINKYLEGGGENEEFKVKLKQVADTEHKGDELRRLIEQELYSLALIPDLRADVMSMLEDMDSLLNVMKEILTDISIETPQFPDVFHSDIRNLTEQSSNAAENVVMAARSFLRDLLAVRDYVNKVMIFEKEADQVAIKLKREIFSSAQLPLAEKAHLRNFVDKVDHLADAAEDVSDLLSIYTIKRMD